MIVDALLVVAVLAIMILVARAAGLPRFNAVSVYAVPWIIVSITGVALGGVGDQIRGETWAMITIAALSTLVGSIFGWKLSRQKEIEDPSRIEPVNVSRLLRIHLVLFAALATHAAIQLQETLPLIQQFGGIQAILTSGDSAFRQATVNAAMGDLQSGLGTGGLRSAALNYGFFLLGMPSIYTGALLWKARHRIIGIAPVALSAAVAVVTLNRTSIMLSVLLFIFALIGLKWTDVEVSSSKKKPKKASPLASAVFGVAALGAIVWVFAAISSARGQTESEGGLTGLFSEYLVGGLAGLNARNASGWDWPPLPAIGGGYDPSPGLGAYTFGGLWAVLHRLGFPVELARHHLDFTPVTLFGRQTETNVAGAIGEYYLDYRIFGIILLPFVIGFLTSAAQKWSKGSRLLTLVPTMSFLLTVGTWSFFVSWFSDFRQTLLAILAGPILVRLLQRPREVGSPPERSRSPRPARR